MFLAHVLGGIFIGLTAASVFAQTDDPAASSPPALPAAVDSARAIQAEITADDVYVRSGDSSNHYPVCKLNAGNRITIVGERGDWYEILPPPGTFGLVSGDYVDTADGQTGIINGENVRVRAGSLLNENKYTVQTMLQKGATVTILGRNPDGFLRIEPPAGATLWISKSYVRPAGALPADIVTSAPAKASQDHAVPQTQPVGGALSSPVEATGLASKRSATPPPATGKWREELAQVDALAKTETAKAVGERNFDEILSRYQTIAAQTEDEHARQFAAGRIEEIKTMSDLAVAIDKVRRMGDEAETKRREFLEGRASIPNPTEPVPRGAQVQGELRISALYPPGGTVVRYRLVDPLAARDRTIAYVEIPAGSSIKPEGFIGRYVGVVAYERRLHTASVDPVPIYIASELMLLEPPQLKSAANN